MASSSVPETLHFMCIPAAVSEGPLAKSFDEVRIDDYLVAYQTTGRSPLPCPQVPTDAQARTAMRLPPLFEPTIIRGEPSQGEKGLPEWQVFEETISPDSSDRFQTITAAASYAKLSLEELRCNAYLAGRVYAPPDILKTPTLQANGIQYRGDTAETFLSITSKPEYALHSFEELRVAYIRAGKRELTSKEILDGATSTPAKTPVFGGPALAGGVFSFSPAIRPF